MISASKVLEEDLIRFPMSVGLTGQAITKGGILIVNEGD